MTGGVVTGGWEFVWAAYGLTFAALAVYGGVVVARLRGEEKRSGEHSNDPGTGGPR